MASKKQTKGQPKPKSLADIIAEADTAASREEMLAAQARLRTLLREGFKPAAKTERPYAAAIEMTEAFREAYMPAEAEGGVEGAFGDAIGGLAVDVANALSRAERRVVYRLKTLFGFNGLRLVEEGDSWTQYPIRLEDIVDQLDENSDVAIYSVGAAGDLVTDMASKKEYLKALRKTGADGMILSGGGNDLFGDFERMLLPFSAGGKPEQLIKEPVFQPVFTSVMDSYQTILTDVALNHPGVIVFGHGYDLPYPTEDGNWIGPALLAKGIPLDLGRDIVRVIMDRFNEALLDLASANPNFVMTDLRTKVDRGPNSWFDELHPKNAGYGRASAAMETTIRTRLSDSGGVESVAVRATTPVDRAYVTGRFGGLEANALSVTKTVVLDPGHGGTSKIGGSSWNNAKGPAGTLEKDLTLDIALRTRDLLKERGFKVLLTRDSDRNLSLTARAAVAKNARASAFLSIHLNGYNGNVQGTETLVDRHANDASRAFSLCVQAEMVDALGHRDRNFGRVKEADRPLGVLNPNNHHDDTAVALHEVSFMDVADEEARLSKVSYRRRIAMALADGIETYLDEAFPAAGLEIAGEGFGDAIEIEASRLGLSSEDYLRGAERLRPDQLISDPRSGAVESDISNGHLLAGEVGDVDDTFLWALAKREAHYAGAGVESAAFSAEEGGELDDYDPEVERAFSVMGTNVEANFGALERLFHRGPATPAARLSISAPLASDFDPQAFIAFMDSLGLRYFTPTEFLVLGVQHQPGGKGTGLNTCPPAHLWSNISNTARLIDEIRHRLGVAVFINSAYRSPTYNRAVDGAARSQHLRFNALDWRAKTGTPGKWLEMTQAVIQSNPGAYHGWVKAYDSFVHIDTRHTV